MRRPAEVLRSAYPQALATLTRIVGDLETAQDALQDASERALLRWQEVVPDHPAAWLVRVARNATIDQTRHRAVVQRHAEREATCSSEPVSETSMRSEFRDDMLRLIFTCCHPTLTPDSQVALTLHTVVGLSVAEIARAYLVQPTTMERRISRARRALRDGEVPYDLPTAQELPQRLDAVCAVILVLFNEGYTPSDESPCLRPRLCELAIRLARLVARSFPANAEVSGLLALVLLQHSRSGARQSDSGRLLTLQMQDRARWNRALITEGRVLVERTLRRGQLGPYQVQAAIAAVHATAETFERTDWPQIVALYDVLLKLQPTAVVRLNRAVAVGRARGSAAGLDELAKLESLPELARFHLLPAARADLLVAQGRVQDAVTAYRAARDLAPTRAERSEIDLEIRRLLRPD